MMAFHPKPSRRTVVILSLLALILLSLPPLLSMRPDLSSAPFLPDGDARSRMLADVLSSPSAAGTVFLEVSCPDPARLQASAQKAADMLSDGPLASAGTGAAHIAPEDVLALCPSFFDAAEEARLTALLDGNAMSAHLDGLLRVLRSPAGTPAMPWLRADPLGMRNILLSRLPSLPAAMPLLNGSPWTTSDDGRRALMVLRLRDASGTTGAAEQAVLKLEEVRKRLAPEAAVVFSGGPLHAAANASAMRSDISRLLLLTLAGFALVYLALVRSRGALWILAVPALATLFAASGTALAFPGLSGLALGFGASLMGISEDYAVHMHYALRSMTDLRLAERRLRPPLFQAWILNSAGFAVLLFSGIPAVRQLALFSLLSLAAGFLLAVLALPALPWPGVPRLAGASDAVLPSARANPAAAVPMLLFLAASTALLVPAISTDFTPAALGSHARELAAQAAAIRAHWPGASGAMVVVPCETGRGNDDALRTARLAAEHLRRGGLACASPSDFLPPLGVLQDNLERWDAWRCRHAQELKDVLAECSREKGFSQAAFAPFLAFLDSPAEASEAVLSGRPAFHDLLTRLILHGKNGVFAAIPVMGGPVSGSAVRAALGAYLAAGALVLGTGDEQEGLERVLMKERRLLPPAALACLVLLVLFTRSFRRLSVVCIPPAAALLCIAAVHALPGATATLMTVMGLPMIFGLALDHGVMMSHSLETGEGLGMTRAVVVSSLTAFLGMGMLAFADHPALRSMGITVLAGLFGELAASLLLLPLCHRRTRS